MTLSVIGTHPGNTTGRCRHAAGRCGDGAAIQRDDHGDGCTLDLASFNQPVGSLAGAGDVTLGSAKSTTATISRA